MKLPIRLRVTEERKERTERTDFQDERVYPAKGDNLACPDVMDTPDPLDLTAIPELAEIGERLDRVDTMVWLPEMVSRAEQV